MIDLAAHVPPWAMFLACVCAGVAIAAGLLAGLYRALDDCDGEETPDERTAP